MQTLYILLHKVSILGVKSCKIVYTETVDFWVWLVVLEQTEHELIAFTKVNWPNFLVRQRFSLCWKCHYREFNKQLLCACMYDDPIPHKHLHTKKVCVCSCSLLKTNTPLMAPVVFIYATRWTKHFKSYLHINIHMNSYQTVRLELCSLHTLSPRMTVNHMHTHVCSNRQMDRQNGLLPFTEGNQSWGFCEFVTNMHPYSGTFPYLHWV